MRMYGKSIGKRDHRNFIKRNVKKGLTFFHIPFSMPLGSMHRASGRLGICLLQTSIGLSSPWYNSKNMKEPLMQESKQQAMASAFF